MWEYRRSPNLVSEIAKDSNTRQVFIVGSGRSGTTWLQLLLAQHPEIATAQETDLFGSYLGSLERSWTGEAENPTPRRVGLRNLLSDEDFYGVCRVFATRVVERILESKPGASIAVEKSPSHFRHAGLILKLFPEAHFLHVVRDPRSVVVSMQRAGGSWGRGWAPTSAYGCALRWIEAVQRASEIKTLTQRYREVRYEALLNDGPRELQAVFEWIGAPADEQYCGKVVEACSIENLQKASGDIDSPWELGQEPSGFYRRGEAASWREELTRTDLKTVEYLTRDWMARLGYPPATSHSRRKPLRLVVREAIRPVRRKLASMLYPLVERLAAKPFPRS